MGSLPSQVLWTVPKWSVPAPTERNVRRAVIEWLFRNGYSRNLREKSTDEHGVDIRVRHNRYSRYFLIETKGDPGSSVKHPDSSRDGCMVQALGQLVTRMNVDARHRYGVGLPETYHTKVLRRLPWKFCRKVHLCVLLVSKEGKVSCVNWRELRRAQRGK